MENVDTIIGANVRVKGSMKNNGSIQINGHVDGEIRSDQMITIGETAVVVGPVNGKTIEISGIAKGVINASEKIEINPKGQLHGDIITKSLIIKQGAIFNGKCQMPVEGQPIHETESADKK